MDFAQKNKINSNEKRYHIENLKIVRNFSKELLIEMNEIVRSIVLFGSNTDNTIKKNSDIDLMIVLNNVSVFVTDELRESYKIITNKLNETIANNKIHIMTINLSDLWDMARKGDPILINVLRSGMPIFDRDLIEPLQYLLEIGKIRPTKEAINNYIARSLTLFEETEKHIQDSILDLYYAVIDIVHASLMSQNITPPSPKEMPKIFKKTFKKTKFEKYSNDIEFFYKLSKEIETKQKRDYSGKELDQLKVKAKKLITDLEKFTKLEIKNNNNL